MNEKNLPDIQGKTMVQVLQMLCDVYPGQIVFTSSFGMEDQAVTHIICSHQLKINISTIDTGRMFEETYKVFSRTRELYGVSIEVFSPDRKDIEKLLSEKGPFSFYESVENRKECCYIRKVLPLQRLLSGKKIWITGLRSEQSDERENLQPIEWDDRFQVIKYHPLLDWSLNEVKEFISRHHIPYNVLHDRGYPSIGCAPCTRAICEGENIRAGRWWWESQSKKECGLHSH